MEAPTQKKFAHFLLRGRNEIQWLQYTQFLNLYQKNFRPSPPPKKKPNSTHM